MSCNQDCRQGRDCTCQSVDQYASSRLAFTRHCSSTGAACEQPFQCGFRCEIEAAKNDRRWATRYYAARVDEAMPVSFIVMRVIAVAVSLVFLVYICTCLYFGDFS